MTPLSTQRRCASAVLLAVLGALALSACGDATMTLSDEALSRGDAFVKVTRSGLVADAGADGVVHDGGENFYLAINKKELESRWFLSAYLTQWHPSENLPLRSLGTRVVTFKIQNGKLFVFDATQGKTWSDSLDPSVVVEAYPIVTDYAPFNALPSSSNYVLFDPSAGLNRFSFVSDDFAATYWARFQVDLSYLQKFRSLDDGISYEQVFTGYTEVPGPGVLDWDQPFRGSGTIGVALRRYSETAGFTPMPLEKHYFGSSNWQYIKNEYGLRRYAVKWNIQPGMQPIQWRISDDINEVAKDPRLAGVDVYGAVQRGVENWNSAFGFPVFQVVPTSPGESPGDDDKNFIVVDSNPSAGYAFANWRENPNTGEIRGASVYFSSTFIENALWDSAGATPSSGADAGTADAGMNDAGTPPDPAVPTTCDPRVVISQLFGGNTSAGAYNQDYVELHNRTSLPVSLSGWSIQYAAAGGSSWQAAPLSGTIAPGGYFLVGMAASGWDSGTILPATDATAPINLAVSSGKVALVQSTVALAGACPSGTDIVDFIGYGSSAICSEGTAAPAPSSSLALFRGSMASAQACLDTQSNATDLFLSPPLPRNSTSPADHCACTSSSQTTPSITDGGVLLAAPRTNDAAPRLSWDAMPAATTCTLRHDLSTTAIPAGMTRVQFIEAAITHTILHEIGHTLGLRHNFKGSLQKVSVMDYLREDDGALLTTPGAYDVDAVKYLYGLSVHPPAQPFCTDEGRLTDAQCDLWDTGASPLHDDVGPRFTKRVTGYVANTGGLSWDDVFSVTRYIRAPATEQERVEAFNILMGQVAPPLPNAVKTSASDAAEVADRLATLFLENLFLDPEEYRDEIGVTPALDDTTFRSRVIEVTRHILVNSDQVRGFASRRVAVDVLKALQTSDAYQALLDARTHLVNERAQRPVSEQPIVDDLINRLDAACAPYFK